MFNNPFPCYFVGQYLQRELFFDLLKAWPTRPVLLDLLLD